MSELTISVDGKEWSELDVLKYRLERAEEAISFFKRQLGLEGMRPLFDESTEEMTAKFLKAVEESNGEFEESIVEFDVPGVKAEQFLRFFATMGQTVNSHPEHYYLLPASDGTMRGELCESIGEAPPLRLMNVHLDDPSQVPVPYDPDADVHIVAETFSLDGESLGVYAMHQLYNTDEGLHAVCDIFFPAQLDPSIVEGHKRHLVIEFGSWFGALLDYKEAHGGELNL